MKPKANKKGAGGKDGDKLGGKLAPVAAPTTTTSATLKDENTPPSPPKASVKPKKQKSRRRRSLAVDVSSGSVLLGVEVRKDGKY